MDIQRNPFIFVGYPKDVKGYILLHPNTHKLIIIESVLFDEHPPQHLGYSYDFPYFELTSLSNDSALEEKHDEVLPTLPNWGKKELGPLLKGLLEYLWPIL
jgi:hypothetical protein